MNTSCKCGLCQFSAQEKHDRMPETANFCIELWRLSACMSHIFSVKGSLQAFHGRRAEENKIRATHICSQFQYHNKLLYLLQWTSLWPRFTFWKFFRALFAVFHKFFLCRLFALNCKLQQKSWALILGLVLYILRY